MQQLGPAAVEIVRKCRRIVAEQTEPGRAADNLPGLQVAVEEPVVGRVEGVVQTLLVQAHGLVGVLQFGGARGHEFFEILAVLLEFAARTPRGSGILDDAD